MRKGCGKVENTCAMDLGEFKSEWMGMDPIMMGMIRDPMQLSNAT